VSFIATNGMDQGVLIGRDQGARHIFLLRQQPAKGSGPALHRHNGDEAFRIMRGLVRIRIGTQTKDCGPGEIALIPPQTDHAFLVLEDAEIEVFGEQEMGSFQVRRGTDGQDRLVEVFMDPPRPWHRTPPPGAITTSAEEFETYQRAWHAQNPL
jgi:mannose-6-phosphate isomerase-like protein (cupin superfamily)